jgi:DnaJ-class molecular chaperone|tara:strand:- start:46 stop:246 length:201 start_codon:yes stop_codon:yes gene_type:complete
MKKNKNISPYKNKYTGDLFGVEDCKYCNGTGIIETDLVFSDLWKMPCGTREDDCEDCNGTGIEGGE